ncbi:hypothetical protein HID58_073753, partial [Brassica napus]
SLWKEVEIETTFREEIRLRKLLAESFFLLKNGARRRVLDSDSWWLKSHFVEYGVVGDSKGNGVHEILVVSMLAPWSYRRAYVIDLQCHSSKICLYCVLRTCVDVGEILVEPGQKLKIRSPIDSESSFTFWLDMRCMFQESLDFMCTLCKLRMLKNLFWPSLLFLQMLLWKGFTHPFAHLLKDNLNLLKIHLYLHLGINKFLHASLSQ